MTAAPLLAQTPAAAGSPELILQEIGRLRLEIKELREAHERDERAIAELNARLSEKVTGASTPVPAAVESSAPEVEHAPSAQEEKPEKPILAEQLSAIEDRMVQEETEKEQRLQTHVYGSLNFEKFQDSRSAFDAESLELVLSAHPHKRIRFFAETEFERAAEVGGSRGGVIKIEQSYAELSLSRWLNARAGVMLVPFGYFNQNHFSIRNDHVESPLLNQIVIPEDWSDAGFGFTGHGSHQAIGWRYEVYVMNGLQQGITGHGLTDARPSFGADNNGNKSLVGQIRFQFGASTDLGFSYYRGKFDDAGRQNLLGYAVDWKWGKGPFEARSEYGRFSPQAGAVPAPALVHGVSTEARWTFRPPFSSHSSMTKDFENQKLAFAIRYDQAWVNSAFAGSIGWERRFTVGLNYRPNENLIFKTDYLFGRNSGFSLLRDGSNGFLASLGFFF